jgi:cobalt/nickel transport system ATP-binding protein
VDPLIRVRGLGFTYEDGVRALDGVDFDLMPGETVALLGANGSGKTTFVLHLVGLLSGAGEISIHGRQLTKQTARDVRRSVGLLFQDADEQLFMPSVIDDVAFGPLNAGKSPDQARDRAEQALSRVGMGGAVNRAPYHLSAGEKRRVALAAVLALDPAILILDEPTTALDPPAQRQLLTLLRELPQAKIIATHDVPFARAIATRAVFFVAGRVAASGSVDAIVERFDWDSSRF